MYPNLKPLSQPTWCRPFGRLRLLRGVHLALLAFVLTLLALGSQAADLRRIALVVGNGNYKYVNALANSRNDARLIAKTLQDDGFTLVGGGAQLDLDKVGFDRAVQQFGQQLAGADVALFYYAGHGLQMDGVNYLVPTGANPTRQADADYQLVNADYILHQMRDADTKLNVILLDACRNNPFGGRGLRAAGGGLAQMQAPAGTIISYATQPGNVAQDGNGSNGPYATALAMAMRQPGLDLFQVFNQTGLEVSSSTAGEQQPWMSNSPIRGQFFFVPAGSKVTIEMPRDSSDPDTVFWQSADHNPSTAAYNAYLQQYPNGKFAGLARARLASLNAGGPAPTIPSGPASSTREVTATDLRRHAWCFLSGTDETIIRMKFFSAGAYTLQSYNTAGRPLSEKSGSYSLENTGTEVILHRNMSAASPRWRLSQGPVFSDGHRQRLFWISDNVLEITTYPNATRERFVACDGDEVSMRLFD